MPDKNGTKTSVQLRESIKGRPFITMREYPELLKEMEEMYNTLTELGKPPSSAFERLILVLQQEHEIFHHPDRDAFWECPTCRRS